MLAGIFLSFSLGLWARIADAAAIAVSPSCSCSGTYPISSEAGKVDCGDPRLGPITLKASSTISSLTQTWDRLGGLCPGDFLKKWTARSDYNNGSFVYPPEDGFQLDSNRHAVKQSVVLCPGTLVDRFGSSRGRFLAPAGTRYEARSIPPSSLVINDTIVPPPAPFNYYVYRVMREMVVTAGCIAPWFGQPGRGTQYLLDDSVANAVDDGFLEEVDPKTEPASRDGCPADGGACKPTFLNC